MLYGSYLYIAHVSDNIISFSWIFFTWVCWIHGSETHRYRKSIVSQVLWIRMYIWGKPLFCLAHHLMPKTTHDVHLCIAYAGLHADIKVWVPPWVTMQVEIQYIISESWRFRDLCDILLWGTMKSKGSYLQDYFHSALTWRLAFIP